MCKTCDGPTSANCTSCEDTLTLSDGECDFVCAGRGEYRDLSSVDASVALNVTLEFTLPDNAEGIADDGQSSDFILSLTVTPEVARYNGLFQTHLEGALNDNSVTVTTRTEYLSAVRFRAITTVTVLQEHYETVRAAIGAANAFQSAAGAFVALLQDADSNMNTFNVGDGSVQDLITFGEFDVEGMCRPCDTSCETCSGPTSSECTTCPAGSIMFGHK